MPDTRGTHLSSTVYYYRRRFDPRAMAAARKVAAGLGMPTDPVGPSVIDAVVRADPLLNGPGPTLLRLGVLDSLRLVKGCEEVEIDFPVEARCKIETAAELNIHAWKRLQLDPVKYLMALLIEMGQ